MEPSISRKTRRGQGFPPDFDKVSGPVPFWPPTSSGAPSNLFRGAVTPEAEEHGGVQLVENAPAAHELHDGF